MEHLDNGVMGTWCNGGENEFGFGVVMFCYFLCNLRESIL